MKSRRPTPWQEMHPQTICPCGCLTVCVIHDGKNSSACLRRTNTFPSEPCRLNLDSSEKITLFHISAVHVACAFAHFSRCCFIALVSNGCFLGRRAGSPASRSLFLTVLLVTEMSNFSTQSRFRSVDDKQRLLSESLLNILSCLAVDALFRNLPFSRSTLPVSLCFFVTWKS